MLYKICIKLCLKDHSLPYCDEYEDNQGVSFRANIDENKHHWGVVDETLISRGITSAFLNIMGAGVMVEFCKSRNF